MSENREKTTTPARWTCPGCGRENGPEMVCPGCGFDESTNFLAYPTLMPLPQSTTDPRQARLNAEQKNLDAELPRLQAELQRQETAEKRTKRRNRLLAAVGAIVVVVALVVWFAGSGDSSSVYDSTTTGDSNVTVVEDNTASDGELITVGFAQVGHESDWRTASTQSCLDVFCEENGYELNFVDCDNDSVTQLEAVRTFIQQEVDYIIIDPIVSTGWDTVLTECEEAGIPVIVIDRTIDDSDKYAAWVGSNFTTEGLAAGEWLNAYAEATGTEITGILVIEGTTGASATIGRTEGFQAIAETYGWTILDSQDGDFTQDGGQEVMESYCKSYEGQFNVVICQNDNEAFGAMTAMTNAGVSYGVDGGVILISFDACTAGLEYVQQGLINADFECNPLAAPFVAEVIEQLEAGEAPETTVYMEEHWFTYDDTVSSFTVNGEEQTVTVVTDEVVEAQY